MVHNVTSTMTSIVHSDRIFLASQHYLASFLQFVESVPGGAILIRYIQVSYQDDPIRSVVELSLVLFAVRYFLSKKTSPDSKAVIKLSEKEIDEICRDWKPKPLVDQIPQEELYKLKRIPISDGKIAPTFDLLENEYLVDDYAVAGKQVNAIKSEALKNVLNLASNDFLDMALDKRINKVATEIIKNHGVGACGPPGFFGNQDIHIELENRLAEWFGTEAAIIYGQDFCTAESIIPAFLKRGDIALVDAGVNLSIQKAVLLSRCQVIYYKHNDLDHLTAILEDLKGELKDIKPLNRRYIISEGLFANYGDYPDVARLVEIKNKYKFRLFLDETLSIGSIGKNGRGLTDFYNVPAKNIDILVGSLANAIPSSGGFCVGAKPMVFNQRIASAAYCFSASLPPYCAKVAHEWIDILEEEAPSSEGSSSVKRLSDNALYFHQVARKNKLLNRYANVVSVDLSPIGLIEFNAETKEKLGFKKYYINENNKFAVSNEKALKYCEKETEPEAPKAVKKEAKPKVENGEEIRVDYYSEEAIKARKAQEKAKLEKEASKVTEYDLYNLEEFLITKISNDLLVNDKILIVSTQRLLNQEILRVKPYFQFHLNKALSKNDIDRVVDRFSYHLENALQEIISLNDVKKAVFQ